MSRANLQGMTSGEVPRASGLLRALLVLAAAVTVPVALVSCGVIAYLFFIVSGDLEMPGRQTLVSRTISLEPNLLSSEPTDRDWYEAAEIALRESGWDLDPTLTSVGSLVPCKPDPSLEIDNMVFDFVGSYRAGLLPSVKWATVVIDRSLGSADVRVTYEVWEMARSRPDDSWPPRVDLRDALAIADGHGGRVYREMYSDVCDASLRLSGSRWRVRYRADTRPGWERWWIWVDAETGEAWRAESR